MDMFSSSKEAFNIGNSVKAIDAAFKKNGMKDNFTPRSMQSGRSERWILNWKKRWEKIVNNDSEKKHSRSFQTQSLMSPFLDDYH